MYTLKDKRYYCMTGLTMSLKCTVVLIIIIIIVILKAVVKPISLRKRS